MIPIEKYIVDCRIPNVVAHIVICKRTLYNRPCHWVEQKVAGRRCKTNFCFCALLFSGRTCYRTSETFEI